VEKDLGILVDKKLDKSQQCALAAGKTSCILHKNCGYRSRKVTIPFCSALVTPHVEHCIQFWGL